MCETNAHYTASTLIAELQQTREAMKELVMAYDLVVRGGDPNAWLSAAERWHRAIYQARELLK